MTKAKYVWVADGGENMCDLCAALHGTEYESLADIPELPHPNCKCMIQEVATGKLRRPHPWTGSNAPKTKYGDSIYIKPDGTRSVHPAWNSPFNRERFSPNGMARLKELEMAIQKENKMKNEKDFDRAYNKLKEPEGGYTDGKNQKDDEPTKYGIKQSTLDNYIDKHPEKELPDDVYYLKPEQAKEIYKKEYWDNTRIPDIKNERIKDAAFDMNVMSYQKIMGETIQKALNAYTVSKLEIDGRLGTNTINALNALPNDKIEGFMKELKATRLESLRKMKNWETAKGGWKKRTNAY